MTGDTALRLYVYGTVGVLAMWVVLVGWLTSRAAWRMVGQRLTAARAATGPFGSGYGEGRAR